MTIDSSDIQDTVWLKFLQKLNHMKNRWINKFHEIKNKIIHSLFKIYITMQEFIIEVFKIICCSVLFLLFGAAFLFVLLLLWFTKLVKREKR